MAKVREITFHESQEKFKVFKKPRTSKEDYDFSDVLALRQLLTNEKARILHAIKHHKPKSVYELSKILKRGFKSVNDDVKLLQRFGFIELMKEKDKQRIRHRPRIAVDTITIHLKI